MSGIDQRGIDEDFPQLYEMAQRYDFAKRLGVLVSSVCEEADHALREIWMARAATEISAPSTEREET